MIATKDLYMQACHNSNVLHQMTDEERFQLQAHLRQMYLDVEKICDKHNLTIMLAYGSVLGAVRHQGFIPWDDDMDVCMPREDYDKFVKIYALELPERYKVFAPNGNSPISRFAKVVDTTTRFLTPGEGDGSEKCGIFLDIFPLENTPVNKWHIKYRMYVTFFLEYVATSVSQYVTKSEDYKQLMNYSKATRRNYRFRNFIGMLFSWRSYEGWLRSIDKFTQYSKDTGYYARPVGPAGYKSFMPVEKSIYTPVSRGKFDDIEVYLPNQPIAFCEMQYGDWQKLPPEEERWQHFIKDIKFEK